MSDVRVLALDESLAPALASFFEASHSSCFCRYWHFTGNKNEWLDRCAHAPEKNRDDMLEAVRRGEPGAGGLVALLGDRVVGWMKLVPRSTVPKLRRLPVYGSLDLGDDARTFSIGCLLVHPDHREQGVARALVRAAPSFVRERGGSFIEAYPRRSDAPLYPEEAWMGPERLFLSEGFEEVAGAPPYPVLRKSP